MLSDANPMVVANALAAMQEIQEVSGKEVLQITPHTLFKLLAALNECTEWGQVGSVLWTVVHNVQPAAGIYVAAAVWLQVISTLPYTHTNDPNTPQYLPLVPCQRAVARA
jgi:vesicle coat complex subunit